jgi:hypothetical protein
MILYLAVEETTEYNLIIKNNHYGDYQLLRGRKIFSCKDSTTY